MARSEIVREGQARAAMALAPRTAMAKRPAMPRTNAGRIRRTRNVAVTAHKKQEDDGERRWAAPKAKTAGLVAMACAMLLATAPDEALAAGGGRVGGRSFRSQPRPRTSAPRAGGGYGGYYGGPLVAPPIYGGGFYGFSPFMPVYGMGFGGGFIFQIALLMFFVQFVRSAVSRVFGKRDEDDDDDDDDFQRWR